MGLELKELRGLAYRHLGFSGFLAALQGVRCFMSLGFLELEGFRASGVGRLMTNSPRRKCKESRNCPSKCNFGIRHMTWI